MKKLISSLALGAVLTLSCMPALAQENLLAEKPIKTLGEPKTWSNGDNSYSFITDDLVKLVAVPANTSNVYLYPENGAINTEENQAKGAQGFYIDLGTTTEIGNVYSTWEGAAADSYDIYVTDVEPTPAILAEEATYSASGLGQYTENTAIMPDGTKGRYLVFQVTKATNWGWGVKIRSIAAYAPADDVLTSFAVTPGIIALNQETPMSITALNQFGLEIPVEDIQIIVSDNATYEEGNLIITSGTSATFTATLGDETIVATVYVATAPESPAATSIKTPIYTNTVTDYNEYVDFTTAYNGGANKNGEILFADGEVAMGFGSTRCVFFSNKQTTGDWNANLNPQEQGWRNLCLDIFSAGDVEGTVEFESVENLEGGHTYPFTLTAGEWTTVKVNVAGATKLGNLSVRFTEANKTDVLLSNIYFTPAFVEGDEEAPELGEVSATPSMTSIELTFSATDDLSEEVYYSISDGTKTYGTSGLSGETVTYTIYGLAPSTTYNLTITASDGLNISEPSTLEVKTLGMPDAEQPTYPETNICAVYSTGYGQTVLPVFDSWGSTAAMGITTTETGQEVLLFSNYAGQWGGLVNLDLDVKGAETLCVDIFSETAGEVTIAPVWAGANGAQTPGFKLEITEPNVWKNYQIDMDEFGYDTYGTEVIQIALTESTLPSFAIDNLFFAGDSSLAVAELVVDAESANVDVYTLQGVRVKSNVKSSEATQGLPAGIYIIGSKKAVVK